MQVSSWEYPVSWIKHASLQHLFLIINSGYQWVHKQQKLGSAIETIKYLNYLTLFVCGASLCIPLAGSGARGCVIARVHKRALTERAVNLFPSRQGFSWPPSSCPRNAGTFAHVCDPCQSARGASAEGAGTVAAELYVDAGIRTRPLLIPGQLPPHCTWSCRRRSMDMPWMSWVGTVTQSQYLGHKLCLSAR